MATFETNVFRDGQWQTNRRSIHSLLQNTAGTSATAPEPRGEAPSCGILTRTLVDSPIVHQILPARLRSRHQNDVVFIGDYYVQVNELRNGSELHEVLRKSDFDSRIVNACILGATNEKLDRRGHGLDLDLVKPDPDYDDVDMADNIMPRSEDRQGELPPHLLLLILESGTFVFLYIQQDGDFASAAMRHPDHRLGNLGFHLAVDPFSRYIAVGDVENKVVVYEVESWEEMNRQYRRGETISPIKSHVPKTIAGLVHKMEFLHPRPQDDYYVILLLVVISKKNSNMVIYDWELGDNLAEVLALEKQGHRLPTEHRMPLFIIPLTVRNSFLMVSEHSIGFCKDPLQGPPVFELVNPGSHRPSPYHHGQGPPLWTAWDRPVRRRHYYEEHDHIYLAREDGVIAYWEMHKNDLTGAVMNVGTCSCSISTAFTTMEDSQSDLAIIAGDSGPGMICQLKARQPIVELGTIPNWSPTRDFVTTTRHATWNPEAVQKDSWDNPDGCDRMFCISGKGTQGNISELRFGLAANIGWDIGYGSHVQKCWIFEAMLPDVGPGFYFLLTLPDASSVLQVPHGSDEPTEPDPSLHHFDLLSRTLAAAQNSENLIIQVTETSIVLVTPSTSTRFDHASFSGVQGDVVQATIMVNFVAIATHHEGRFFIHTFRIEEMRVNLLSTFESQGEVTSLAFCTLLEKDHLLVGTWHNGHPSIAVLASGERITEAVQVLQLASAEPNDDPSHAQQVLEPVTSMVVLDSGAEITVAIGLRSGHLVTLCFNSASPGSARVIQEKIGSVAVDVSPADHPLLSGKFFVCCNDMLLLFGGFDGARYRMKHRVIANDIQAPDVPSPPVHFATSTRHGLGHQDHVSLLLLSGDHILISEMSMRPKCVPRTFRLNGTPTKLLFSQTLRCLVVAVRAASGGTTLAFVDPDTTEDMGVAFHHDRRVGFVKGLREDAGRVQDMAEWIYDKDGKRFLFIVVATLDGSLVIIKTEPMMENDDEGNEVTRVRYMTRNRISAAEPVHSIVGSGADLFYCAGNTLHWAAHDMVDKRFKTKKTFELPSPASSLRINDGKVYALTTQHSLLVVDHQPDQPEQGMTLLHSDVGGRVATHYMEMGDHFREGSPWPVSIICEFGHELTGVWIPLKEPRREFQIAFSGELPVAIRRLTRGHVRPRWRVSDRKAKYGYVASTVDGADVLGMALDGSLHHFVLLSQGAWKVMEALQKLCLASHLVCPFAPETASVVGGASEETGTSAARRHIRGDILQRCLDRRLVGEVVKADPELKGVLQEALDELDGGEWTSRFRGSGFDDGYTDLMYSILEYYLGPVL